MLTLEQIRDFYTPNIPHIKKYLIKDGRVHPFALVLPGGGYRMTCSNVEGLPFAKELNKRGYHVFVLRYSVGHKARFPQPVNDVAKALKKIIANLEQYMLSVNDYLLVGSSAGGHLAGLFSTTKHGYANYGLNKPKALILVYPVVTMINATHAGSKKNLLGKNPSEEMMKDTSLENLVDKNFPPTYFWCGDADKSVPNSNSFLLEEALKKSNIKYRFDFYHGVGHGVGLALNSQAASWFNNALDFINQLDL